MKIMCIGVYPSISYRGSKTNLPQQERQVIEAAKRELEMIKEQGQKAGTDAAWWRSGFSEAKATLESIVKNEEPSKPENRDYGIMSFHSFNDEDGFI